MQLQERAYKSSILYDLVDISHEFVFYPPITASLKVLFIFYFIRRNRTVSCNFFFFFLTSVHRYRLVPRNLYLYLGAVSKCKIFRTKSKASLCLQRSIKAKIYIKFKQQNYFIGSLEQYYLSSPSQPEVLRKVIVFTQV